jgi:hypothetical protein
MAAGERFTAAPFRARAVPSPRRSEPRRAQAAAPGYASGSNPNGIRASRRIA